MKTAMPHPQRSLVVFNAYHLLADYRSRLSWAWFFEHFSGLAVVIGMGTLTYFLITHFVFQSLTVSGSSMYPTLFDNGNYWLNRSYYFRHEPQRTDIVALKDPVDGVLVVKRIIAMPGESIYLNRGKVYVNGKLLDEPYISKYTPTFAFAKNESEFLIIGKDSYFVLGDNRGNSMDSRSYGPVPRGNILGKLIE
ncbi:MAG: signal peptidase I [Limisphaerales bacterium]